MLKTTIASALILFGGVANAQIAPQPALQVQHPQSTLFTDIVNSEGTLIAVGKHGTVVTSTDGETWQQAKVPVQSLLTAVTSLGSDKSWACGHDSSILFSSDHGQTWQIQQYLPQQQKPCLDIEFVDANTGFAIGAYGMFYQTNDGGQSWKKRFIDDFVHPDDKEYLQGLKEDDPQAYEEETKFILPHFNRLLIHEGHLYLAGEMGLVAYSEDMGKSWQRLDEFYPGSFFSVAPYGNEQVVVAGLRGNAFIANSEELEFSQIDVPVKATINSIVNFNGSLYLLANSGFLFSYDNGQVKRSQLSSGHAILSAVTFKNKLVLATEKGLKIWEAKK
ncbi:MULTISPECIES: WD40/YVTN/BNR-like repeat-containing protein [Pseudoalteromonas]|uniref:Uncharacterized protein n=1 Tax=Pseudoalteromonas amylolytica TaxID=1859457 RepID=A0A1S1MWX4_9GAMM|nr:MULTISPECIES: YCF48-related protein [Pseudoalteromonas]OHU87948.1 hypothetical protein BFC16_11130 [Pseudoalteromonas sp. JW3]OHU91388.1 hypothetical protein BET10_11250 [Pseudoalteromonas amylolytica]